VLVAEPFAGSSYAADNLVDVQQNIVFLADFLHALPVAIRRCDHATPRCHRLKAQTANGVGAFCKNDLFDLIRGPNAVVFLRCEDASAQRTSEKQAALKAALGPEATGVFNQIESEMAPHENMLNLHDNWYLSILGLHPSQQGKGLGAVLLRPVLDEADKAGVASYLTTFSQGNIKFYEKVGFEVMGQFPVPATGSDFSVLVRPPRPV